MTAAKATKMMRQVTQMQYMTTEHLWRTADDQRWRWRRRRRRREEGGGKSFPHLQQHAPLGAAMTTRGSSLSRSEKRYRAL